MPDDRDTVASASGASLRGLGARAGVGSFLRWWLGELAFLVPRPVRMAIRRRRLRPVLQFEGDMATLWLPRSRQGELAMEPVASIPLSDAAAGAQAGRAALEALARSAHGGSGAQPDLAIALPARQVLRRTISLPAALEENLRQALGYDLDRHTPFKADELYFDAVIVGRDATGEQIRVELAAAKRPLIDQALQRAESWGANVVAVVPDAPSTIAPSRLNLLPDDRRMPSAGLLRPQFWIPAALVATLAIVAVALPILQKRAYAIELHRMADAARNQAAVSERLRAELDALTGDYNFALERKFAFPSSLQVLEEVTKLLPDGTWLTQFEMKTTTRGKDIQRELLLRGESGNAGRLIAEFEASQVFTQAAPRSPTTKIQPGPGEIFDLTAQLRPLPSPVALRLVTAGPADATPTPAPADASPAPAKPAASASVRAPNASVTDESAPASAAGTRSAARTPAPAGTAAQAGGTIRAPSVAPDAAATAEAIEKRGPSPSPASSS